MQVWFVLSLVAAVLWVAGNVFDKVLVHRFFPDSEGEAPIFLGIFSSLFGALVGLVLFAYALTTEGAQAVYEESTPIAVLFAVAGGIVEIAWIVLYLHVIEKAEVSRTVPVLQLVPVFGLVFARILVGEVLTAEQIAFGLLIVFGAVVVSVYFERRETGLQKIGFDTPSLVSMVFVALLIASADVLFKKSALEASYLVSAAWMNLGGGVFAMLVLTFSSQHRRNFVETITRSLREVVGLNSANEVMDISANLTFLAAVMLAPVALVQTTNAFQPVGLFLVALLASRFGLDALSEDVSRSSIVVKVVGISLITLGSWGVLASLS